MQRTTDQHIAYCQRRLNTGSLYILHIAAAVSLATMMIGQYLQISGSVVFQYAASAVMAASIFSLACNFLYGRLADGKTGTEEIIEEHSNEKQSLETIGRLTAGVAHEFNNSLMILMNCIDLINRAEDSVTRQRLLSDMESAVRSAQSSAAELSSMSMHIEDIVKPCSPRSALRSVADNLRRFFPETITVRDFLRGTPVVALPAGTLEQMVLKISLNARDSMPQGGELILRCFEDTHESVVIVEIEDTVPAELQDARCQQEKEAQTGYRRLEALGGSVDTVKLDGQGTRTTICLPVAEIVSPQQVEEIDDEQSVHRALILDDNELLLTMLHARLELAGYKVVSAKSVSEALKLIQQGSFDALVCDAVLPDGNPVEAIRAFRRQSGSGSVVVCSGYPKDDPILSDLKEETAQFLQKPFSTDELVRQLRCAA